MDVCGRIKELRKTLKLNQIKFGEKLGVSRDVINNIENGRLANPNQKLSLYKLICKEFNVSEKWLLDGTGDMFAKSEEISLDDFARQHGATDFEIKIIKAYFSLSDELRHEFLAQLRANFERESSVEDAEGEYIKKISSSAQSTESTASSSTDATA